MWFVQTKTLSTGTFRLSSLLLFSCFVFSGVAVAGPSITLSARKGPPTTKILVSGSNWGQNAVIDIYFDTVREALAVTDGAGVFSNIPILAPWQAKPGNHLVTALENGNSDRSQQTFLVQTDWAQAHFSPDHAGWNPYENVVSKSNVADLKVKWRYVAGLYVVSAPAIVDGTVFFGSDDTNVYALDAKTGIQLWKFATAGYVDSSPAVAYGLVYIGSEDHNLYALDPQKGTLSDEFNGPTGYSDIMVDGNVYATSQFLWSFTQGLQVDWRTVAVASGSPATANDILCASGGAQDATISAHSLLNGQPLWQYNGPAPATSSPVLAGGRVYFAMNQDLYALDASDGAVLWTYHTGGSIGMPAVANGIVYAGSNTDLFAWDARRGTLLWKNADRRRFTVESLSIANGVLYLGTDGGGNASGSVYAIDAATGAPLWQYLADGAVFSSPVIANGVLYFGTHGGSVFALSLNGQ